MRTGYTVWSKLAMCFPDLASRRKRIQLGVSGGVTEGVYLSETKNWISNFILIWLFCVYISKLVTVRTC